MSRRFGQIEPMGAAKFAETVATSYRTRTPSGDAAKCQCETAARNARMTARLAEDGPLCVEVRLDEAVSERRAETTQSAMLVDHGVCPAVVNSVRMIGHLLACSCARLCRAASATLPLDRASRLREPLRHRRAGNDRAPRRLPSARPHFRAGPVRSIAAERRPSPP